MNAAAPDTTRSHAVRAATAAWLITALYYFYQYTLRSAPAVMMPQLSDAFGLTTLGVRLRVSPPHNICLIRTSQDVNRAGPEQMAWYRNEVEPTFLTGLRYLRENGEASGCIGGRFVIEKDDEGCDAGRSCAVAYFTSLGTLEAWTHRHPTHEAIMASFINMVRQFQGEPGLHLWHEVSVFPRGTLSGDRVLVE